MFRANVLRSAVASVARVAAARPAISSPVARLAVRSAAPATWMPKTAAAPWSAVRCYAAAAGLDKTAVEERIIALLRNFDKVRCALPQIPVPSVIEPPPLPQHYKFPTLTSYLAGQRP